jgi:hypothetical protein
MPRNVQKLQQPDSARVEFLIARYSALREEMQNRYSYVYQVTSLNLTIAAAILTFGLQTDSSASVLFLIPITSMLLGIVAMYNFLARKRLELIIKSDIEMEFDFVSKVPASQRRFINRFIGLVGVGGIFVIVQILALALGLLKIQDYSTLDIVLIISDILSVFIALWSISTVIRAQSKNESSAQEAG